MPRQKKVFRYIFLGFSLLLLIRLCGIRGLLALGASILPVVVAANEVLTRIVEGNVLYLWVQGNVS